MTEIRTTSSTGGQKGTKPERYDLIPTFPLAELARLYGEGAKKYDDHNWAKGYELSKSYAALSRHLNQFWNGIDRDEETGVLHLANVAWHAFTMMELLAAHPEFDDRRKDAVLIDWVSEGRESHEIEPVGVSDGDTIRARIRGIEYSGPVVAVVGSSVWIDAIRFAGSIPLKCVHEVNGKPWKWVGE
ncbi:dATP/dGTP diphosphohydrolase domain-containing protein [Mycetocola saprophilus]|uniref:dATP/dGTP diphosphohydrolase domain-containing protein n=1 Tax=Mycetocola saprophilus TaxID=76636 RepID=UPI0006925B60|nr:dATP/dGTP diphosphohydrolase domain-containing protein [Mycetocola saprophilus]